MKGRQKIWAGPSPPSFGQYSVFIRKTSLSVFVCVSVFVFWLLCFVQVEADYGGAHPLLATTWPTAWRNFQPAQGKSPTQENTIRKHDTNRKSQTQESNPRKHDTNTTNGVTSTQLVTTLQEFYTMSSVALWLSTTLNLTITVMTRGYQFVKNV